MENRADKKKALVGLSGGVDSTAAVLLLKEKGLEVTGLYFQVKKGNEKGIESAKKAANELGINIIVKDVSQEFDALVISDFCSEYMRGRTPNPCIRCNPLVKFQTLLAAADEIGAYYIATGHYARNEYHPAENSWFIHQSLNEPKDQSYMLYRLSQKVLSRLLFPLERFDSKAEVRSLVGQNQIANAEAKDSQEICFLEDGQSYIEYIQSRGYSPQKGDFVNKTGDRLGEHQGLLHYTIGQRKGLGITFGKPVFVTKLNDRSNQVTLGDHEALFSRIVHSKDNWFPGTDSSEMPVGYEGKEVLAKIRYASRPARAVIEKASDGRIKTTFVEGQRALTPGQSLVFYDQDRVIGGGIIDNIEHESVEGEER